ncbi:MAG: hypothetical protein R2877_01515 [Bdellovibrionota bacterium]
MPILKLSKDDPQKEEEFELEYLQSLTSAQRFQMMEKQSRQILVTLVRNGKKKPFEIIKRPIR